MKGRKAPEKTQPQAVDYDRLGDALCQVYEAHFDTNRRMGLCMPIAFAAWTWLMRRDVSSIVNIGELDIRVAPDRLWGFTAEQPGDQLMNGDFHTWVIVGAKPSRVFDPTARYWKDAVLLMPENRWERNDVPPTLFGEMEELTSQEIWYRADRDLTERMLRRYTNDPHHLAHQREVQPMIDRCYKQDMVLIGPGNF